MPHLNYLVKNRKDWELSQREVAVLAGFCRPHIGRIELGEEPPSLRLAFALQIMFGQALPEFFPALYAEVGEAVLRRASRLDKAIAEDESATAERKREFLRQMVARVHLLEA